MATPFVARLLMTSEAWPSCTSPSTRTTPAEKPGIRKEEDEDEEENELIVGAEFRGAVVVSCWPGETGCLVDDTCGLVVTTGGRVVVV